MTVSLYGRFLSLMIFTHQKKKNKKNISNFKFYFSKGYREPDIRERRDSKTSNDIGRDWDEARHQESRGNVTPERTRKRLSSFEDIKVIYDE